MTVPYKPDGFPNVCPYLVVNGAAGVVEFIKQVFDGQIIDDMRDGDQVMHASIRVGDSIIMLGDAGGPWQPMPAGIHVYVKDVDATYKAALEAGATSMQEPADQFYGDRSAGVKDKAGVTWWIATHVEDLTNEEINRRAAELKR